MSARAHSHSLAVRLGVLAAGGSLIALAIAGLVMATLQRASAERAFDEQLGVYVSQLFADFANKRLADATGHFADPAFALPGSGWYWTMADPQTGEPLLASASLFDPLPPPDPGAQPGVLSSRSITLGDQRLRLVERGYTLDGQALLARVSAPTTSLEIESRRFVTALLVTLGAMWLALLLLAFVQVRVGLRPLKSLQSAIGDVRAARASRVEGDFPLEVAPLVGELNAMIATNADLIERARHHVGNLAHALKTPLAVILNATATPADPAVGPSADPTLLARIRHEAQAIDARIRVYLDRAQRAAQSTAPGQAANLKAVLDPLVRTMAKLSLDQNLDFAVEVDPVLRVRLDPHDLEEMLGNLLENACRHAASRVCISAALPEGTQSTGAMVHLHIDDDGPGLAPEARLAVLERGKRLDEARPGSGLGLAIVLEMVELYGGSCVLSQSPMGGLRASLALPSLALPSLDQPSPTLPSLPTSNLALARPAPVTPEL